MLQVSKIRCPLSQNNFNPTQRKLYSRFMKAQYMLSEDNIPQQILCRKKQMQKIKQFIQEFMVTGYSKQSLYISGVPGIGKTLSVIKTIEQLQKKSQDTKKSKIKFIKLNSMKLKNQADLYKVLYKQLLLPEKNKYKFKCNYSQYQCMVRLDNIFRGSQDLQAHQQQLRQIKKLVVIDQLDYLKTTKQQILYNIFQWTQSQKSKLAIIAISNTIDFPQRLKQKIQSRIGNCRLVFQPYNSIDLQKILNQRIDQTQAFDLQALKKICKRISMTTSDIRKCLAILRQAIYLHVNSSACINSRQISDARNSKVSYKQVDQAYQNNYNDYFLDCFKVMPKSYQKILVILAQHFNRDTKSAPIDLINATAYNRFDLQAWNVQQTLINLLDLGLVEIKHGLNTWHSQHYRNMKRFNFKLIEKPDKIMAAALKFDQSLTEDGKNSIQTKI